MPCPEDRRPDVDVEDLRETRVVLLQDGAERRVRTGVVDKDVDAAELGEREVDTRQRRTLIAGVCGEADGAIGVQRGRCGIRGVLPATCQDHSSARIVQRARNREADAPRRTRHNRGTTSQLSSHCSTRRRASRLRRAAVRDGRGLPATQLALGDRALVDLVGSIRYAKRAHVGPHLCEREVA